MYVFDEYKDDQRIAYNLLKNSLETGKLSHAYLIDTNNYEYSWEILFFLLLKWLFVLIIILIFPNVALVVFVLEFWMAIIWILRLLNLSKFH